MRNKPKPDPAPSSPASRCPTWRVNRCRCWIFLKHHAWTALSFHLTHFIGLICHSVQFQQQPFSRNVKPTMHTRRIIRLVWSVCARTLGLPRNGIKYIQSGSKHHRWSCSDSRSPREPAWNVNSQVTFKMFFFKFHNIYASVLIHTFYSVEKQI